MPVDAFNAVRTTPPGLAPDKLQSVHKHTWTGFHRAVAGTAASGNASFGGTLVAPALARAGDFPGTEPAAGFAACLMTTALGGEAMPPAALRGALTRKPSLTLSAAQSSAGASGHHNSACARSRCPAQHAHGR